MEESIVMKIRRNRGDRAIDDSKFFGAPVIPASYVDEIKDLFFLCQIKLSDLTDFSAADRLNKCGYVYFFFDLTGGRYVPIVKFFSGKPDVALASFNKKFSFGVDCDSDWPILFESAPADAEGIKLFGIPANDKSRGNLLLQYDPMQSVYGFLDGVKSHLCVFHNDSFSDFYAEFIPPSKITIQNI